MGAVNLFLSNVSPSLGWSEKFFDLNDGETMSRSTGIQKMQVQHSAALLGIHFS
jgi:hypothetical protein